MTIETEIQDDLSVFTDEDFGVDVVFGAATVKAIFHNEYESIPLFSGEVESRNPYIEGRASDFPNIAHDSIVTIGGVAYKAKEIKPDGTGMTVIELSKD
jgi:hypothetical protein